MQRRHRLALIASECCYFSCPAAVAGGIAFLGDVPQCGGVRTTLGMAVTRPRLETAIRLAVLYRVTVSALPFDLSGTLSSSAPFQKSQEDAKAYRRTLFKQVCRYVFRSDISPFPGGCRPRQCLQVLPRPGGAHEAGTRCRGAALHSAYLSRSRDQRPSDAPAGCYPAPARDDSQAQGRPIFFQTCSYRPGWGSRSSCLEYQYDFVNKQGV